MTWISLPYGEPGAGFDAVDLKNYMLEKRVDHIIQGHRKCSLAEHSKPNSLDYWLRERYTKRQDTMHAVRSVVRQLVGTGMFYHGQFTCPDSGCCCQGIALR